MGIVRYLRLSVNQDACAGMHAGGRKCCGRRRRLGSRSQRAGSLCHLARHIMSNFMAHVQRQSIPRLGVRGNLKFKNIYVYAAFQGGAAPKALPLATLYWHYSVAEQNICFSQLSALLVAAVFYQ